MKQRSCDSVIYNANSVRPFGTWISHCVTVFRRKIIFEPRTGAKKSRYYRKWGARCTESWTRAPTDVFGQVVLGFQLVLTPKDETPLKYIDDGPSQKTKYLVHYRLTQPSSRCHKIAVTYSSGARRDVTTRRFISGASRRTSIVQWPKLQSRSDKTVPKWGTLVRSGWW